MINKMDSELSNNNYKPSRLSMNVPIPMNLAQQTVPDVSSEHENDEESPSNYQLNSDASHDHSQNFYLENLNAIELNQQPPSVDLLTRKALDRIRS